MLAEAGAFAELWGIGVLGHPVSFFSIATDCHSMALSTALFAYAAGMLATGDRCGHDGIETRWLFREANPMMTLLSSPLSPYGRKVKMTAAIKGLSSKIALVLTDTNKGDPALNKHNPLAKIPCLITEDGMAIYDSHVICEYLDSIGTGPVLFPRSGAARWQTLTGGALADGMIDAALLLVYEKRFRPENMSVQGWMDRQWAKINQSLDHLEVQPPQWSDHPDYAHLTLATALGYLDFRHGGTWRGTHPRLVAWLDDFARVVPAFEATRPVA